MDISALSVTVDNVALHLDLSDGRSLSVPLAWFPRLVEATPAEREKVRLSDGGLHWDDLDEDISVAGLLAGRGDQTRRAERAA